MPGSGKQAPEIQEQIKELLEAGFDPTTIHRRLKVGRSSIYRMKRCLQQHGTNYMPKELNKKNGRPKVLTAEQELVRRTRRCRVLGWRFTYRLTLLSLISLIPAKYTYTVDIAYLTNTSPGSLLMAPRSQKSHTLPR